VPRGAPGVNGAQFFGKMASMRKDLQPLCDLHGSPMKLDVVYIEARPHGPYWSEVYACPETGCRRYYNPEQGYFRHAPGGFEIDSGTQRRELCSRDGAAMYLASAGPSAQTWRCESPDCERAASSKAS
jgi:hypothetical protein